MTSRSNLRARGGPSGSPLPLFDLQNNVPAMKDCPSLSLVIVRDGRPAVRTFMGRSRAVRAGRAFVSAVRLHLEAEMPADEAATFAAGLHPSLEFASSGGRFRVTVIPSVVEV